MIKSNLILLLTEPKSKEEVNGGSKEGERHKVEANQSDEIRLQGKLYDEIAIKYTSKIDSKKCTVQPTLTNSIFPFTF